MSSPRRAEPTDIEVDRDHGVTIEWDDGHGSRFGLEELRLNRPCAECRGVRQRDVVVWARAGAPEARRVETAELVGGYGMSVVWNDSHSTGDLLRGDAAGLVPLPGVHRRRLTGPKTHLIIPLGAAHSTPPRPSFGPGDPTRAVAWVPHILFARLRRTRCAHGVRRLGFRRLISAAAPERLWTGSRRCLHPVDIGGGANAFRREDVTRSPAALTARLVGSANRVRRRLRPARRAPCG